MLVVALRTFFEPEAREDVLAMVRDSEPVFHKQPGLVSFAPYLAEDGTHVMTLLEWETREHHERCIASADFAAQNATWSAWITSGRIRFEMSLNERIAD